MRIKEEFQVQDVMGENLVVRQGKDSTDMTQLISLNPTALVLWNQFLGKNFQEEDVIRYVLERYEVDNERATADVHRWVNELKSCQVLTDD